MSELNIRITQKHMDILRSQIERSANIDEQMPELRQLDQPGDWISYYILVAVAFSEAVGVRFGKKSTPQEVIKFVGDVRAQSEASADGIHPEVAESLILEASWGKSTLKLESKIRFINELQLLCPILGSDLRNKVELDRFTERVWERANRIFGPGMVVGVEEC